MSVPTAVLSAGNQQAIVALLVAGIQMIDYGHPDPILIPDIAQGIKCSAIDIETKWAMMANRITHIVWLNQFALKRVSASAPY